MVLLFPRVFNVSLQLSDLQHQPCNTAMVGGGMQVWATRGSFLSYMTHLVVTCVATPFGAASCVYSHTGSIVGWEARIVSQCRKARGIWQRYMCQIGGRVGGNWFPGQSRTLSSAVMGDVLCHLCWWRKEVGS